MMRLRISQSVFGAASSFVTYIDLGVIQGVRPDQCSEWCEAQAFLQGSVAKFRTNKKSLFSRQNYFTRE